MKMEESSQRSPFFKAQRDDYSDDNDDKRDLPKLLDAICRKLYSDNKAFVLHKPKPSNVFGRKKNKLERQKQNKKKNSQSS